MAVSGACLGLRVAGALWPDAVERVYVPWLFRPLVSGISGLSAYLPFSVAEMLLGLGALAALARLARRPRRDAPASRRRAWRERLTGVALAAASAYLVFLLMWGLNYDRPPLARVLSLDARPASVDELAELVAELLADAGRERVALAEDEHGAMRLSAAPRVVLRRAGAGYARLEARLPALRGPQRPVKALLSSALFSRLGISGIYVPFTAEAHVNVDVPASGLLFAACHELAHQRGFAREDEASFVGYLACRAHPEPEFRYSAAFEAQLDVLAALAPFDPQRARELALRAAPGVRRDRAALAAWLARYAGPARSVSQAVNDAYLRSQGQADGVRSYGRVVDLLLAERRVRHATALSGVTP